MSSKKPKYYAITAAKNEERFIGQLLKSMVEQTVRPVRWTIVSDGSTDGTDRIVEGFVNQHEWIELVRIPVEHTRNFAGKARAVNDAYSRNFSLDFQFVVNIDSDVSFEPDYFEFLLGEFEQDPGLGVAGTPYLEGDQKSHHRHSDVSHVSGQVQLFRRECFEEVGGYPEIEGGAIDWIAVTTARMKGWRTHSFDEKTFLHHREMGTASHGVIRARFHYGRKAYYVGGHPVWEMLRGIFKMKQRPIIIGGLMHHAGFLWAAISRMKRPISDELMSFHRREQMSRIHQIFGRRVGGTGRGDGESSKASN